MTDQAKRKLGQFFVFAAIALGLAGFVLWNQAEQDARPSLADEIIGNPAPPPADHTLHVGLFAGAGLSVVCSVILLSSVRASEQSEP